MSRPAKLPPLPARFDAPDAEAIRQLALCVQNKHGRAEAHRMADYYEQLLAVNEHNATAAREGLRMLREALGEVVA